MAQRTSFRWLALAIAAGSLGLSGKASATLLFEDEFNYATGSAVGDSGGTGFSSAYTTGGNIATPGLTFPALVTAGNTLATTPGTGAFRSIPGIDTNSGTLWVSFLEATNGATPIDYAGLSFFSSAGEEVFLGRPNGLTNYGFSVSGVANSTFSSAAAPAVSSPSFLLYRFTFSTSGEVLDFFANDTPGVAPTTPTLTFNIPEGSFASTFNQIRMQSGTQVTDFDEVRAGTTYADVAPVPEPASLAFLLGGGLFLAGRHRRP